MSATATAPAPPVYAIGDLQGCLAPLRRLLEQIDKRHDDAGQDRREPRLWFCGDLVNRGPASLATLRLVRGLHRDGRALAVLGNHDLTVLAAAEGYTRPRRKDTYRDILEAPDAAELLDWLRRLPLLHDDRGLGFTLVHAGLAPQWDLALAQRCAAEVESALRGPDSVYRDFLSQMFGSEPARWDERLAGFERLRFITNVFTRLRFCTAGGKLSFEYKGAPGSQPADLMPWFQVPGRRSAGLHIVFGHWAALGFYREPGVYALDSGCVWGGRLTALRLDGWRRGTGTDTNTTTGADRPAQTDGAGDDRVVSVACG